MKQNSKSRQTKPIQSPNRKGGVSRCSRKLMVKTKSLYLIRRERVMLDRGQVVCALSSATHS